MRPIRAATEQCKTNPQITPQTRNQPVSESLAMSTNYSMENMIQNSCNSIINTNSIRLSDLNYSFQETPFSIYLTIRKSIVRSKVASLDLSTSQQVFDKSESEGSLLKSRCQYLEEANATLKYNYEQTTIEIRNTFPI